MTALMVALGALVGAPLRYVVDQAVRAWHDSRFPWGTLAVNVSASLVLGVLAGSGSHLTAAMAALVGTGFCGSLSTYSTFGYENHQLAARGLRVHASVNVTLSLVAGIGVAAVGWLIGGALA